MASPHVNKSYSACIQKTLTSNADPLRRPRPMLDIHPAHHAASTWRDFFIHIATICIGLLIAIGLEQTVEALHRQHERSQIRESLHSELLEIENDTVTSRVTLATR